MQKGKRMRVFQSFEDLADELSKFATSLVPDRTLKDAGSWLVRQIQSRTRRGKGIIDGKEVPLAPLAKSTQKQKRSNSICNLTDSGTMLGDIGYRIKEGTIKVRFASTKQEEKARYHMQGTSKMPSRPFFLLSLKDLAHVNQVLNTYFDSYIERFL
jgi:hypothetical protein